MTEEINVKKEVIKLVAKKAGTETAELTTATYLEDDLNIGALELMELWSDIEETLEVEIDEEDKEGIETIEELIELVEEAL